MVGYEEERDGAGTRMGADHGADVGDQLDLHAVLLTQHAGEIWVDLLGNRLDEITIDIEYGEDGLQRMILNGEDVTRDIRLPQISMYASAVSAIPAVRAFLLEMHRALARRNSVIMDGRDIATVVLPDAEVKIFLTASAETRARRREKELMERGTPEPFEKILSELQERDYNDSHRAEAPLRQAEDAVLIDTTELNFEESKEALIKVIREKTGA